MSHEVQVHSAQTSILRELLFAPEAGFAQLQKPTGLTSNHFNFHIARLVELGLVEQVASGRYRLTTRGKEYANRLDTDNNTVERQPKCAVLLLVERERPGREEYVFQQRLKHPYFGFWGRPTGKIRWGETIVQCAGRELMEETGLTADCTVLGVYHELTRERGTGDLLEDKIFFYVRCSNVQGELKEQFEGGRNAWMTLPEVLRQEKTFGNFRVGQDILDGKTAILEGTREYDRNVF
jgi:ADP-ribose pyrophosphatase YjhB (NUDIX family)